MRKIGLIALLAVFLVVSGCAYTTLIEDAKKAYADNKEKSDALMKAGEEAVAKLGEIIDKADKDEVPEIKDDGVGDAAGGALKAVAPLLPPPYGTIVAILAGLAPGLGAWLKANSSKKKRELEEALLIKALNELKHNEPEMFKKFLEYRDKIASGMMTAKQVIELLNGIEGIKTKYS